MATPDPQCADPGPAKDAGQTRVPSSPRIGWAPVLGCAAACLAVQLGGGWWAGAAGVAAVAWLSRSNAQTGGAAATATAAGAPLVHQVVAVWMRLLDSARQHAEHSTNEVLGAFTKIDERLEEAVRLAEVSSADLSGTNVDALIDDNQAVLDQLLVPLRQAIEARDSALTEVDRIGRVIDELLGSASRMRQVARRINMVALNEIGRAHV
jgi:hypothetical protein